MTTKRCVYISTLAGILIFVHSACAVTGSSSVTPLCRTMPYWRALLLVYKGIDSDYTDKSGKKQHVQYTLSPSETAAGVWNFRNFPALASMGSERECFVQADVVYVDRPITSLSPRGSESCWPSPTDTHTEINLYGAQNYDSIMAYFTPGNTQTKQFIPTGYWGLGMGPNGGAKGATYAAIMYVPEWMWGNDNIYNRGQVWLHEWLHGSCGYYRDRGVRMTERDADGAIIHNYEHSPQIGWMGFYHDLMTGNVKEGSQRTGIDPKAWRKGAVRNQKTQIFADYFSTNTLCYYKTTGTCTWDAEQHRVVLEKNGAENGSMQAAAVFQKSYTVTGRINLPEPDNAEESASISLAVLHGQSEYAGTVSYGKAGSGQAFITITRNGTPEKPCAVQLKPGWHTIRLVVDRGTSKIKMKIWPDDENEPDWQASRTFIARWPSTSIGYRHEGTEPICVDDLYAMETILKNPNENTKRISSLKK